MEIKRVAIIGMGALGLMYGAHIERAIGREGVAYILDEDRYRRYQGRRFTCNGAAMDVQLQKSDTAAPYDLVIIAVKYNSLPSALGTMRGCVGPQTVILSVMNGIDSEEIIAGRYGRERIVYTVAQGMDAMREGSTLHYTQMGQLIIGRLPDQPAEPLEAVAGFFTEIGMPHQVEENILYRMWAKWMLNIGINQTCMVFDTTYYGATRGEEPRKVLIAAMKEVVALSRLEGVCLKDSELEFYLNLLDTLDPEGYPSMEQDRKAGRPTEVEMFAGTLLRLAEKHGLPAPANRFLYDQVKEIEAGMA